MKNTYHVKGIATQVQSRPVENQQEFPVRSDIPIPSVNGKSKHNYPWAELAVGDCFFAPVEAGKTLKTQQHRLSSHMRVRKNNGTLSPTYKITMRTEDARGTRVWRIA